jgi:hypothetical protein
MNKADDREYEEVRISKVEGDQKKGWLLARKDGWCFGGIPKDWGGTPKAGMLARFYGRGIGSTVRGLDLDGVEVFYRSAEEQATENHLQLKESECKQFEEFQHNRKDMDKRVAALPEVFRTRIQKFREANKDFRWKFEGYELFTCEEAVKIAARCKTLEEVKAFHDLPWEEQKKAGISDGHSGNTFGMACRLASWFLTKPENVTKEHGALVALVGCDEYGCAH